MISSSPEDIHAARQSGRAHSRAHRRAHKLANFFWHFAHAERRASLFLPLAILFFLSLISYDSRDSSFNTASGSSLGVENWLGIGGAIVSDLLVQLFGKGSWLFVCVVASFSVRSSRGIFWRHIFLWMSLLLASSAYALLNPEATNAWPAGGGGILGESVRNIAYSDNWTIHLASICSAFFASLGLFFASAPLLPRALYASLRSVVCFLRDQLELLYATLLALNKAPHKNPRKNFAGNNPYDRNFENKNPEDRNPEARNFEDRNPAVRNFHSAKKTLSDDTRANEDSEDTTPLLLRDPIAFTGESSIEDDIPPPHREDGLGEDGLGETNLAEDTSLDSSAPPTRHRDSASHLPPYSLLSSASEEGHGEPSAEELRATSELLEKTLSDYGVRGSITDVQCGPVITLYALEPVAGVKASRVVSLSDDIARTMRRISVRIAVIPGKNSIGIELPNPTRQTVILGELLTATPRTLFLPLALGKSISGTAQVVDLADMPHLLIAGTTGAGKSVGINAMILSLLYRHAPETCRLILIDPKMLELSAYQGIPHLLAPVITDHEKALSALRWAALEMERRYRLMSEAGVRNISGYRRKYQHSTKDGSGNKLESLPYIVIIVDEMADLMLTSGRSIEMVLQRLAQMARAAGIHMIVATQRPSVDVITGTIKANFPTRISYRVASKFDSRTILNEQGAEMLLGRGDMLFMPGGSKVTRIHGPFVGDEEVEATCNFLRSQAPPNYVAEILETKSVSSASSLLDSDDADPLYNQAIKIVAKHQRASTSFLQRQLQIGYNRAARIIERMEEDGIVGMADGTGKRSILTRQPDD